ncbi:MAG: hypothetical protein OJF48_004654 [Afipia sp.]|nr:MAG: hypothetical protein OJF48_004654 [Afipia sp.]
MAPQGTRQNGQIGAVKIRRVSPQSQGRPTKRAKIAYLNENTLELSLYGGLLPFASVC